jgi:hypothetical protein
MRNDAHVEEVFADDVEDILEDADELEDWEQGLVDEGWSIGEAFAPEDD